MSDTKRWSLFWWLDILVPVLFGWLASIGAWWWAGRYDAPEWARMMFGAAAYFYAHDDIARRKR